MTSNTISVSIHADRAYTDALFVLARQKNMTVGKLIRETLDEKYKGEIDALLASFFANGVAQKQQMLHGRKSKNGRKKVVKS